MPEYIIHGWIKCDATWIINADSEDEAIITWPDNGVDTMELIDWEAQDVELNE